MIQDYKAKHPIRKRIEVMLSGDLSFSFQPIQAVYEYWTRHYEKFVQSFGKNKMVIIFSRINNFRSLKINNGFVSITAIDSKVHKVPLNITVFASSSNLEDESHMLKLRQTFGIKQDRLITLGAIEQMWGLLKSASIVFTDRYHPGYFISIYIFFYSIE